YTVDNLRRAFQELDGSRAPGIGRVTKQEYRKELQSNLEKLQERIRKGGWRPRPSREVLIPKPQGGMRPLAIGCLEDKIVQLLIADPFFLRQIRRLLRCSVLHTDGKLARTETGTPQGSPVSPILANICLNAIL